MDLISHSRLISAAHPGYIFVSHFFAFSNSCHSCIYNQIFFSSELKLKMLQSCRLAKQGPILGTIHGCNFILMIRLLHLNSAFVFYDSNRNISESCLAFSYRQHSLLSGFLQNSISEHIPSALGRNAWTGLEE